MKQKKQFNIEELLNNLSVLNTSIGVKMIDDLTKNDPKKACAILYKVLGKATDEEIALITDYRQDFCRSLCRLCFYNDTFEQSVAILLRFALKEKDGLGSASIGLQRIFFPLSGATEANLKRRSDILNEFLNSGTDKELLIKLLDSAISIRATFFHYDIGEIADRDIKPYLPTDEEKRAYFAFVLDVLRKMTNKAQGALREELLAVLNEHFIELCRYGFGDLAISTIESVCIAVNNRWDKLLDNLLLFREEMEHALTPEQFKQYETLVNNLNSNDFCFRFKRVEKELYGVSSFNISLEKKIEQQRKQYEDLAEEFVQKKLLSRTVLEQLYDAKVITTSPFGEVVAKGLSKIQRNEFIDESIDIINGREKTQSDILVDFAFGTNDEDFDTLFNKMTDLKDKSPLFAAVARRSENFNNPYMDKLLDLVKTGQANSDFFVTYWFNFRFAYMKDEDISGWMVKVRNLPEGTEAVLHILQSAINGSAYNSFPVLVKFALDTVEHIEIDYGHIMGLYQYWNVVRLLLNRGNYAELARKTNCILMGYIKHIDGFIMNNYEVTQTYHLLLKKYFNEIWSDISDALLSDGNDSWFYYRLKEILGSMLGNAHNDVGLLFENDHSDTMIEWCQKNPTIAPVRLMEMAPVFEGDNFSKIVYMLIDGFGQNKNVMKALGNNLCSFAWIGSVIPLYNKEIKALETLKGHRLKEVQDWSTEMIDYLKSEIEKEAITKW